MNQSTNTDPVSTILLADDFTLPLDSATATMAILGKKGRGKTHTAAVFAEGLISAGIQTTVLDPTGAWYGLRSSSDGAAPGLPVVIFGGEHADVPVAADLGEQIATILVERRFPELDQHRSRPITPPVPIQTDNQQLLPRLFVDDETQFRYEIGETWLRHLPEGDRQQWPLRPFQLGSQFLSSLTTDLAPRQRILAVAVDVLTRRAYELPARSVHIYGDGSSNAPAITRSDGATAYRATIRQCPGGPRLLWWEQVDGTAELAWVGHHDDPMPT